MRALRDDSLLVYRTVANTCTHAQGCYTFLKKVDFNRFVDNFIEYTKQGMLVKGELTWKIYLCILLPKYVYLSIQYTKNMV